MARDSVWLTRPDLARRWQMGVQTLANWAGQGKGPRARKFGGRVRYKLADVEAWEDAQDTAGEAS